MWDFCTHLFDSSGFPPRWTCGDWTPGHAWLHILSNVGVWTAYCAIPCILWSYASRRKDFPFRRILFLFSLFILSCGFTHLMDAVLFWWPAYRLDGVLKCLTAVVSWATVLALIRVTPRLMALRSPAELEAEIAVRLRVEAELRDLRAALEERVAERTAALEASQQRFRAVVEATPAGLIMADRDGRIVFVNDLVGHLFGWDRDEIIGQPIERLLPDRIQDRRPTDRAAVFAAPEDRPMGGGRALSGRRKDGSEFPVEIGLRPVETSGTQLVLASVIDITSRREAEAALRLSEQRFQAFMGHAPFAAWVVDQDGRGVYTNPGFDRLTGLPPGSFLGRTATDLFPAEIAARHHENDQRVRATGTPVEDEEPYVRPDGSPGSAYVVKFPIQQSVGRPFIGGVAIDITEQRHNRQALAEKTRLLEAVLDSMREALLGCGTDGRVIVLNRAFRELHGLGPDETPAHLSDLQFSISWHGTKEPCRFEELPLVRAMRGEPTDDVELDLSTGPFPQNRVVSITGRPIEGPTGSVGGLVVLRDVSAQKRNEAALRASEERFRCAFEFAPIGVALNATDGKWLQVNRALCELTGYTEAELLGSDFQTITHPDDLGTDLAHLGRLLDGTIPTYQTEKRSFHKRGHIVHMFLSVSLVRDESGRPMHFITHIKDITTRKETERALAVNEALLREFITHSPVAIAMFDRDMRYLQTSERWVHDYKLSGRTLIGASHYDVFPDLCENWKAVHRRVLGGSVERCDEDRFHHASGSAEWLEWECRPWFDGTDEIGGLIIYTQVITQRKRNEEALRASEERFRVLFEHSSDAHLIFDESGGILDCNNAAVALLRCRNRSELLALHPAVFSPELQPDGRRSMEKCVEMDATARRNGYHRFDWLHRRLDGEVFPCEVTLTPVELHGRSALLIVWHDLTERKRAEDLIRASLREKEVLLKEIHHRVKNNLQIVSALLGLQSEHTTDIMSLAMFKESQGRVKSMALIHERLYHSPDIARVDFAEYIRRLATDLYRTYKVPEEEIVLAVDVDVPPLGIDIAIPCGLLLNELISNCLKHAFADPTGGCLRVSLLRAGPGRAVLTVADNGSGLPGGFDIGTAKSFGMQLVATLVEQLNGRLEIGSDRGTTIAVTFAAPKA